MKTLKLAFFAAFMLLAFSNVEAQVNRNIGRSYAKPKKNQPPDYLALSVQKLTEELSLDTFQEAVIKDILKSSQIEQEKILLLEIPNESKNEQLIAARNTMNDKIVAILNPEQAKKFELLKIKPKK